MSSLISCQRHLFDIPEDVVYLNTAYISPLSKKVLNSIQEGTQLKARPWQIIPGKHFFDDISIIKESFAGLFNVSDTNVALIPSTSYGISTAAQNTLLTEGKNILILKDQFPSNVYPWFDLAKKTGGRVKILNITGEKGLTEGIIDNINDTVAAVALPNIRWTDGALINLIAVRKACDAFGADLILDLTQSAGAMQTDLSIIQPDFAIIANYKWMLGPYSTGFLYVSDRHLNGTPLEQTWSGRKGSEDFSRLTDYQFEFQSGADRYDMGERANFSLLPGVKTCLDQLKSWGIGNIEASLAENASKLCSMLDGLGLKTLDKRSRAPHFIGVRLPKQRDPALLEKLKAKRIFVSERAGTLRITPHLWNNQDEFSFLIDNLAKLL